MSGQPQAPNRVDRRTRRARADDVDPRARLIEAAATVFSRRGYSAASVDEIAREAGFSKGAVYWHFDSKAELFLALLEEKLDRPGRELMALAADAPVGSAPQLGRLVGGLLSREPDALLLESEYWARAVRDPELRGRFAERIEAVRTAMAQMLDERSRNLGAPRFEMESRDTAIGFIVLGEGLARLRLVDPDAAPEDLFGHFLGVVYDGLLARAKGLV